MWRLVLPAWLVSVVVHLAFVSGLAMFGFRGTLGLGPPGVNELEASFELSDGDATSGGGAETYFGAGEEATVVESTTARAMALADLSFLDDRPPVDPTDALPKLREPSEGSDPAAGGENASSGSPSGGGKGNGTGRGDIGKGGARTGIFGAEAEGFKFVYVFDRSGSMGGSGRSALNAAKAELLASLEDLGDVHQFQIIFYNQEPTIFPLAGAQGRLVFANDSNKRRAERFIQQITADGATAHEDALKAALALRPDVIFFLTDADEPTLNSAQMKRIEKLNSGRSVIHVIEFGMGPYLGVENFLVRLARENRGTHAYVDLSKLGPAR